MKKLVSLLLCSAFLTLPASSAGINIKSGTVVPITVNTVQTSKTVAAGSKIDASIDKDIYVDNILVFKKGDRAKLNVVQAKKAKFAGIPGELTIAGGEVYDVNNNSHTIDFTQNYIGEEKTWPKVMLGVSIFLLFPLALFGFVKGGQAELQKFVPINVRTTQDFEFEKL